MRSCKFSPSEIICNDNFLVSGYSIDDLRERLGISINKIDAWHFEEDSCQKLLCKHFKVNTLTALGVDDFMAGQIAAGAVLAYLYETQKNSLSNITHLNPYIASKYMLLDSATRRNLELTETLREKQKKGSLLWVLDKTKTAMGAQTAPYLSGTAADRAGGYRAPSGSSRRSDSHIRCPEKNSGNI